MRNRAKCKLCLSIIESFHATDYVMCKCGHIAVDGGEALRCVAQDWNNFLRVDDLGNEIKIKIAQDISKTVIDDYIYEAPTKKEMIDMLDEMIKNIENLPREAMSTSINHYDFCSLMVLLSSIFRADCKASNCDINALN